MSGKKIVIYGLGQRGVETFRRLQRNNVEVFCFCDRNVSRQGISVGGKYCYGLDDVLTMNQEELSVIVAIDDSDAIVGGLKQKGFVNVEEYKSALEHLLVDENNLDKLLTSIDEVKAMKNIIERVYYERQRIDGDELINPLEDYLQREESNENFNG